MSWRDAPLYVEAEDLAAWVVSHALSADSDLRGTVRDGLAAEAMALVEAVALALTFPATREAHLQRADHAVASLRVRLRLAVRAGALSARQKRFAAGRLDAIGRMVGGWRKRVDARRHETG